MQRYSRDQMTRQIAAFVAAQTDAIAALTGGCVHMSARRLMDRSPYLALGPASLRSPNGQCRLIQAADGWLAVNLPRSDDRALLPAWLDVAEDAPEPLIDAAIRQRPTQSLLDDAIMMGLAVSQVGERTGSQPAYPTSAGHTRPEKAKKVADLSSLWAGPLCGSVLAAAGLEVEKIDSLSRPDPVQTATPAFDQILNGQKRRLTMDFSYKQALVSKLSSADILITSARPRAFTALGISPALLWSINPNLCWIAITAHGWAEDHAMRVGFGDDCAAAGGLVGWDKDQPQFLGDALPDPLTGLVAAVSALETLDKGGMFLDLSLAGTAAMVHSAPFGSPASS